MFLSNFLNPRLRFLFFVVLRFHLLTFHFSNSYVWIVIVFIAVLTFYGALVRDLMLPAEHPHALVVSAGHPSSQGASEQEDRHSLIDLEVQMHNKNAADFDGIPIDIKCHLDGICCIIRLGECCNLPSILVLAFVCLCSVHWGGFRLRRVLAHRTTL